MKRTEEINARFEIEPHCLKKSWFYLRHVRIKGQGARTTAGNKPDNGLSLLRGNKDSQSNQFSYHFGGLANKYPTHKKMSSYSFFKNILADS